MGETLDCSTDEGVLMSVAVEELHVLLDQVRVLDDTDLCRLAEAGGRVPTPPAFRGRCLEPVYLDAVAVGAWTADHEHLLAVTVEKVEATTLSRVPRRYRRGLRAALQAVALSVLTADVPSPGWQARRVELASVWQGVLRPVPRQRDQD